MGCLPVRGYNPRGLASGLSYVQVDKHGITILYHYISVDLAHHEIVRAKVGKGGIKGVKRPIYPVGMGIGIEENTQYKNE